jgi:hypothetical protein
MRGLRGRRLSRVLLEGLCLSCGDELIVSILAIPVVKNDCYTHTLTLSAGTTRIAGDCPCDSVSTIYFGLFQPAAARRATQRSRILTNAIARRIRDAAFSLW